MSRLTTGSLGTVTTSGGGGSGGLTDAELRASPVDVDLQQVGGSTFTLGQQLAASSLPVVLTAAQIITLTPPAAIAGFATAANQSTIIGHVDGIEALLTTIDTDTGNIDTSLNNIETNAATLAGAVSGTEMQVDVVAALPAGNNNIGDVDVVSSALPTGASTLAEQQSQTTHLATIAGDTTDIEAAVEIMDDWDNIASDGASVSGDVAHDTADAGEPVKMGGKAIDIGANGTDVSANDRVNAYFLRSGQQLILGGHQNIITKNLNVSDADGAQTDTALVTVSAGTAIVVTMIQVYLDAATTATGGVQARIGFGTANTPALDAAGVIFSHSGIAAGSGSVIGNGGGIIGMGASNEDLRLTCEDPTGGNLDIIITYFTVLIG